MSPETAEALIRSYLATDQPVYSFGWQGGEPTLMGVEFYRRVVELQKRYGRPGAQIANGLQTNGIAVTDEMARLFADYRFLLGVSLDGPAHLHNVYRKDAGGHGTHAAVMGGLERLASRGVEFNILVLVNAANVEHGREVYRYLVDQGFLFHQYIPCVETTADGRLAPFAVSDLQWGRFLSEVHDEWMAGDTRRVSIRHVDSILQLLVNRNITSCTMGGACNSYFVVEHNGDVFPCDFYVRPDLRLGNVLTDDWYSLAASPMRRKFAAEKARFPSACRDCRYLHLCSGDCPKHRRTAAESLLCRGWQAYYDHALDDLKLLAGEFTGKPGALFDPGKQDPESPCYCGSGKKAKHCHLVLPRIESD